MWVVGTNRLTNEQCFSFKRGRKEEEEVKVCEPLPIPSELSAVMGARHECLVKQTQEGKRDEEGENALLDNILYIHTSTLLFSPPPYLNGLWSSYEGTLE